MKKEQLMKHLGNQPLMQAITSRCNIEETRGRLYNALETLREVGSSKAAYDEIKAKYDEYCKISKAYSNLIEDTWEIKWQDKAIIERYVNIAEDEIDELPSEIRL